jgi:quercetin dioxygenase-like cupin family protein
MGRTGCHGVRVMGEWMMQVDAQARSGPQATPRHRDPLTPPSRRIDHADVPTVASPSGLLTQHLVSARDGAEGLFVAQQWLQPGDRVLLHTHPVEEAITFLSGSGEATLGEETLPIGAGVSLYIPAGEVHGFRCTEGTLHVCCVTQQVRWMGRASSQFPSEVAGPHRC